MVGAGFLTSILDSFRLDRRAAVVTGSGRGIGAAIALARAPHRTRGAYAAAKAALINLTATMAAGLAPRGTRVNAISPGMVPTDSFYDVLQFTPEDLPQLIRPGRGVLDQLASGVRFGLNARS